MPEYKRFGNRWTINEYLQLQREFELLQLSIGEIAKRHKRSPNAIMFKLDQEGFADYNVLYSNFHNLNYEMESKLEYNCEDGESQDYAEDSSVEDDSDVEFETTKSKSIQKLKQQVMRIEEKLSQLTELLLNQAKDKNNLKQSKTVFSLFG